MTEPTIGTLVPESVPADGQGDITVRSLVRKFGARTVLDHLDLDIPGGEFVALLGRSGSGKSTLLRALAGLDHDASGSGCISMSNDPAMIFQDARLLPWLPLLGNVTLGVHGPDTKNEARRLLKEVGLEGRDRSWPHALSGGEAQRAALARSLLHHPHVILADEPFSALDALTRLQMQTLLLKLIAQYRTTVVFVTHDVDEAVRLSDRIVLLENGRLSFDHRPPWPRPRRYDDPRFAQWRQQLLHRLGLGEFD